MIIDIHVHVPDRWSQPKQLRRLLDLAGRWDIQWLCISMGRSWQDQPTCRDIQEANDYVLSLMKQWPDRIIGFCYLNPNLLDSSISQLDRCIDAGMRGIKLWIACHCNAAAVFPIVERAIEHDVMILQHAWQKTTGNLQNESKPHHLADLALRYPEAKFVMAHAGGNWQYGIRAIRRCTNVSVDTSGSNPTQGFLEMALRELGPRRIIFGSDAVGRSFASQLAKVDSVKIPKRTRQLILAQNARRLLHL